MLIFKNIFKPIKWFRLYRIISDYNAAPLQSPGLQLLSIGLGTFPLSSDISLDLRLFVFLNDISAIENEIH